MDLKGVLKIDAQRKNNNHRLRKTFYILSGSRKLLVLQYGFLEFQNGTGRRN